MKIVHTSNNHKVLISDEDFDLVNRFKWYAQETANKNTFYARRTNTPQIYMHQLLMPDGPVDHKDKNGLNNQRDNLRYATKLQNSCNSVMPQGPNGSGYRGVFKRGNSYRAQIKDSIGGIKYLGSYPSAIEAALVYNKAAIELHGEFATINKID